MITNEALIPPLGAVSISYLPRSQSLPSDLVPLAVIVNARMSDRSFRRAMRVRRLWQRVIRLAGLFLAQSHETAERLGQNFAEIESRRQELAAMLDSMQEAVVAITAEGSVRWSNSVMRRIAGTQLHAGRPLGHFVRDPDVLACVRAALEHHEVRFGRASNLAPGRTFEINAAPLPNGPWNVRNFGWSPLIEGPIHGSVTRGTESPTLLAKLEMQLAQAHRQLATHLKMPENGLVKTGGKL